MSGSGKKMERKLLMTESRAVSWMRSHERQNPGKIIRIGSPPVRGNNFLNFPLSATCGPGSTESTNLFITSKNLSPSYQNRGHCTVKTDACDQFPGRIQPSEMSGKHLKVVKLGPPVFSIEGSLQTVEMPQLQDLRWTHPTWT